ncbi:alpha-1,2-fucosyltransferase [Larkinella terrae]|uniref:Alpha-1,2-fucosyltransferase n=1 Tax=Larkinella terrae TaxID=2025311 RepID=A0A7K0EGG4_9BACT|nr:alpha-1,2-fucosyltransferase [Larkinella terrae]MRS60940.1 hypothetical protein [Larkinella terrae]
MIVVELMGGLGNQLFQYALGRSLAIQNKTDLFVDTGFLMSRNVTGRNIVYRNYDLDIFTLKPPIAKPSVSQRYGTSPSVSIRFIKKSFNRAIKTGPLEYIAEQTPFQYDQRVARASDNVYVSGYWQSIRYFQEIKDQLKLEFRFANPIPAFAAELTEELQKKESVCVHVRRSDFVTNSRHNIIQPDYYERAERIIRERVAKPTYYVFSDDIDWCRTNLRFNATTIYVGNEWAGERAQTYLQLMTFCRHYIIPNSTFGWWAAWLNNGFDKIVIMPQKWVYDRSGFVSSDELAYPEWIRI